MALIRIEYRPQRLHYLSGGLDLLAGHTADVTGVISRGWILPLTIVSRGVKKQQVDVWRQGLIALQTTYRNAIESSAFHRAGSWKCQRIYTIGIQVFYYLHWLIYVPSSV